MINGEGCIWVLNYILEVFRFCSIMDMYKKILLI